MAAKRLADSRAIGDEVEAQTIQRLNALRARFATDGGNETDGATAADASRVYDAAVDGVLEPSADSALEFAGINLLADGTPVEIKSAMHQYSGQRGRFYFRQGQHEALVDDAGAYLLVVYEADGRDLHILGMLAVAATTVDGALEGGDWIARDRDDERGYRQLSWARFIDPTRIRGGDDGVE